MISKSISTSRKLASANLFTAFLFTWLIPHCDDGGNMAGDAHTIKMRVIPGREETISDIETALSEMKTIGLIDLYESDGEEYLHVVRWEDHQTLRTDRATWEFPKYTKQQPSGNQTATKRQPVTAEVKVREGKVREEKRRERGESFDSLTPKRKAEMFFDSVKNQDTNFNIFINQLSTKNQVSSQKIENELIKFADYWTELNSTGTKARWQLQKTFEVRRRLKTWFERAKFNNFSTQSNKGRNVIL